VGRRGGGGWKVAEAVGGWETELWRELAGETIAMSTVLGASSTVYLENGSQLLLSLGESVFSSRRD